MTSTRRSAASDDGDDALTGLRDRLQRDPKAVTVEISPFIVECRRTDNRSNLARALAIRGRARRACGEFDLADLDCTEAVRLSDELVDPILSCDARIALASVRFHQGRANEALALLDAADELAAASNDDHSIVFSRLQRAVAHQQLGRTDEAISTYEWAIPRLRLLDAETDLANVLATYGGALTSRGRAAEAVEMLHEAQQLFLARENLARAAQTAHSLGWALSQTGNTRAALAELDDAARRFGELGHSEVGVEVDRVQVLLDAGLFDEALELADKAAELLLANGDAWWAADLSLVAARACRWAGLPELAQAQLHRAEQLFTSQGARSRTLAVHLEGAIIDPTIDHVALVQLADAAEDAAMPVVAALALCLACDRAVSAGAVETASTLAGRISTRSRQLDLFDVNVAAAASLAAECRPRDPAAAKRLVRAGLALVAEHGASLGALDARLSAVALGERLSELDIRLAADSNRPDALLDAFERSRTHLGWPTPVPTPEIKAAIADLRELATALAEAEHHDRDPEPLRQRQRELQRALRRQHLSRPSEQRRVLHDPVRREELRREPSVSFVEAAWIDGDLLRVVWEGGRLRRAEPLDGSALKSAANALNRALRSASNRPAASRVDEVLQRAAPVLQAVLPQHPHGSDVVLVLPPDLATVPWPALMPDRVRSVTVAPSIRWWLDRRIAHDVAEPAKSRVRCIAGPRLQWSDIECARASDAWGGASEALTGPAASVEAALHAIATCDVVHLAAHFHVHPTSPMWSSVELADGALTLFDVDNLGSAPRLAVLSACDSGTGHRIGASTIGLAHALLAAGTTSLVASLCPLPDNESTVAAMAALHHRLADGAPVGAAVVDVVRNAPDRAARHAAAALTVYGVG